MDGALRVLLTLDDDVLQARAERDLDRDSIFFIDLHQVGDRPAHAAQRLALRRLHDRAHRLVEALVLLFHLTEQADAGV